MSDTKLHKLKGKTRRNIIKETPLKVKKFFDRKCGSIDDKINKIEIKNKEIKKEDKNLRNYEN